MSIQQETVEWIKAKPQFWQEALRRIIINRELSDQDIEDLTEICEASYGLNEPFPEVDIEELESLVAETETNMDYSISNIKIVSNVTAIRENEELAFGDNGVTVVYGDNGTGKSSYVGILKQVCTTRGKIAEVRKNLFDVDTRNKDQLAEVSFNVSDGTSGVVHWKNNEIDSYALRVVDVFDSLSANHYIAESDEIAFVPSGLEIIEKLAWANQQVEARIKGEINSLGHGLDISFLYDESEPRTALFLTQLNGNSSLENLEELSDHKAEDDLRIQELDKRITELKVKDPQILIKENQDKARRFTVLKSKYNRDASTSSFFLEKHFQRIREVVNGYISAKEASRVASTEAFSDIPDSNVGNTVWRELWESARKFVETTNDDKVFPETDDNAICPLCFQALDYDARERFKRFELFIKNDLQAKLVKAESELQGTIAYYNNVNLEFEDLLPIIGEIENIKPGFKLIHETYIEAVLAKLQSVQDILKAENRVEVIEAIQVDKTPIQVIDELENEIAETNKELSGSGESPELKLLIEEYLWLKQKKLFSENKDKLVNEVDRRKQIALLQRCVGSCNTRGITLFSNAMSDKYINVQLQDKFKGELNRLGFQNINIVADTKGERGKQYYFLKLDSTYGENLALQDVLSEGEHRCISLATFLSELSVSEHNSGIVFDDPVSSLDHKWRRKIAKRIVEEGLERQVIVFTHDITFLMMLNEFSDKLSCDLMIKNLTRTKIETGLITEHPPWDALSTKKRIGELKNELQRITSIENKGTEEEYKAEVKPFYGKLRETWERCVEEVVLNGAVQRFGREIQTRRLERVVDLSEDDYKVIDDNMGKCSTILQGHDDAPELNETVPQIADLVSDLGNLDAFVKEINRRRK